MKILPRFRFESEEMLLIGKWKIMKFDLAHHSFIRFWMMILKHRKKDKSMMIIISDGHKENFISFIRS